MNKICSLIVVIFIFAIGFCFGRLVLNNNQPFEHQTESLYESVNDKFNVQVLETIFQQRFYFELPDTVEIKYDNYSFLEDLLRLKVRFGEENYNEMLEGVKNFVTNSGYMIEVDVENAITMDTVRSFSTWWNEDKEDFVLAYYGMTDGRNGVKTRETIILITQNNEGQYFLHIFD